MTTPTEQTLKPQRLEQALEKALEQALDPRHLFAQGLAQLRQLSSRHWTDHNTHDPGITILELLAYALTELTYRARFPLEDLLAASAESGASQSDQFFTAAEILPNAPLTTLDYRKLLIDLPGVRNAWIEPAPLRYFADTIEKRLRHDNPGIPGIRPVEVRGLYRVTLEYDDDVASDEARQQVEARVRATLQARRNLGEDFVAVAEVVTQPYNLCAELELTADADPIEVAAQVELLVDDYLAPPVRNYRLAEMLNKRHDDGRPYTAAEIFAGPRLNNGFLDDVEVERAELRTDVRLSDIISLIMDVPGVIAVRDIVVNELQPRDGGGWQPVVPLDKWHLAVPTGRRPRLAVDQCQFLFRKRNLPLRADAGQIALRVRARRAEQRASFLDIGPEDLPIPLGRPRDVGSYHSFQHHFPAAYGLSDVGVPPMPDSERARRLVEILQLKGYLLPFDQVMADYLSQLANVGELFARGNTQPRTYFAQLVELPGAGNPSLDHRQLYPNPLPSAETLADEPSAVGQDRRNRLLDHLLARVAEDFHQYADVMRTVFGRRDLLRTKSEFLRDCPRIGAERGLAYDQTLADPGSLWDTLNVSGLERRLARLLGIGDHSRRDLSTVSLDVHAEIVSTPTNTFSFRVVHRDDGELLFSAVNEFPTDEEARVALNQAMARGQLRDGYRGHVNDEGTHELHVVDIGGQALARGGQSYSTAADLDEAIANLRAYLQTYYGGEGIYLIENILLRPEMEEDPFLPICVDSNCGGCADDDPYSYRVQVVLPAYAGRFQSVDFREFVEETIRQETPAHVLPKVCWANAADMAILERAHRDWLALRAGASTDDRTAKLVALRDALTTIKNVYPRAELTDCSPGNSRPPFVLDRTQLGTT